MDSNNSRLQAALTAIDTANQQDPNQDTLNGQAIAKELLYGQRMSEALAGLEPQASEELQIACRAQHIQRWKIPRSDYPMNRSGYLQWRRDLGRFHAEQTGKIMAEQGYSHVSIEKTQGILKKQGLKQNPDTQTLEDVACLVFVKFYLASFVKGKDPDKLSAIIKKTWAKMSDRGQQALLKLDIHPSLSATLKSALDS